MRRNVQGTYIVVRRTVIGDKKIQIWSRKWDIICGLPNEMEVNEGCHDLKQNSNLKKVQNILNLVKEPSNAEKRHSQ